MGQTDFFGLALKVDKENAEAKKKGGAQKHPTTKLDMAHPHDIVAYQKLKDGGATAAAAAGSGTGTVPVPIDVDEIAGADPPPKCKRGKPPRSPLPLLHGHQEIILRGASLVLLAYLLWPRLPLVTASSHG